VPYLRRGFKTARLLPQFVGDWVPELQVRKAGRRKKEGEHIIETGEHLIAREERRGEKERVAHAPAYQGDRQLGVAQGSSWF